MLHITNIQDNVIHYEITFKKPSEEKFTYSSSLTLNEKYKILSKSSIQYINTSNKDVILFISCYNEKENKTDLVILFMKYKKDHYHVLKIVKDFNGIYAHKHINYTTKQACVIYKIGKDLKRFSISFKTRSVLEYISNITCVDTTLDWIFKDSCITHRSIINSYMETGENR